MDKLSGRMREWDWESEGLYFPTVDAWADEVAQLEAELHELARMHSNEYGNLKIANANARVARMMHENAQLEAENEELWKLDKAVGEAFKDYPYENESGIKKMTLQSFAVIQRIRKALEAGVDDGQVE